MRFFIILCIFFFLSGFVWSDSHLSIDGILSSPDTYLRERVKIAGYVAYVSPDNDAETSSYMFVDDQDGEIAVRSKHRPPEIGKRLILEALVLQDEESESPYLYELGRARERCVLFILLEILIVAASLSLLALSVKRIVKAPRALPKSGDSVPRVPESSLTIVDGPNDVGRKYEITKLSSVIGRNGDIRLPLEHTTVSDIHAIIMYIERDKEFRIQHIGDRSITRVSGVDISGVSELKSGDIIEFGATKLQFHVQLQPKHPDLLEKAALLTVIHGPDLGKGYRVAEKSSTIGRNGDIKLSTEHESDSGVDAVLDYSMGRFILRNVGKADSVAVNNNYMEPGKKVEIKPGDVIRLAETEMLFNCRSQAPYLAKLTVEGGPGIGKIYEVRAEKIIIGRDDTGSRLSDTDIKLPARDIATEQAILIYTDGIFILENKSHVCETRVNDQIVTNEWTMRSGDELELGRTKLRFEIPC